MEAERIAKTQDPLALMANSNNSYASPAPHQDLSPFNQKWWKSNLRVQNLGNQNGLIGVQGNGIQNQIGNGNLVAARAEGNAAGQNANQIRCYNCRGFGHYARNCTARTRRRDAAYLQTQLLIAQKEEAGIQLQAEEYNLMAASADLDEIKEVNANCILMANLQQASSSGTQTDSTPVNDSDGPAEVHENFDNNEIFNMFTQEEQYTELLEPIPEPQQVPHNDNNVISEEIWLRVQQMMKGSDIGIQEKKAKLFNEWEMFTSNEGESIESYYHRFLKLMNDLKRNKHFPKKIASNLKFLNNLQPEWSRHVTIVHQTKDLHTADYTQLYDFLKYNQKEVDELKAERLAKNHDPLALMAHSNNPYAFPAPHQDQSPFNQNYLQQPMPNPEDISDPTTAMIMALALMAKAFNLNYSTPTNNNQRISSNPRNKQIAQLGQNAGNSAGYNDVIRNQNQIGNGNLVAARAEGNTAGQNENQIRCYNCRGVGHYAKNCTVRPKRRDAAYLQTQLLIAQKEEAGIQLQVEEYDLMAAAADLDEIEEVNANCILMANQQQASTSGTQTDSAPVYDTDGSAEVHKNCDDNGIFNMFTQEEQYTELLEPILESHQVPQHDNDVISKDTSDTSVEQGGEIVEQHPANFEEARALYESLYQNLAIEVEKVSF
nr:hypothetical protein [Tanacetum cinerariifolium]